MKKFTAVLAVLALTLMASVAMAQVTVDGSVEFLMRSFTNTNDWDDAYTRAGDYQSTYERIRIGVNAKHEGVKGRIQLDTDWDQWADGATGLSTGVTTTATPNQGFEGRTTGTFALREGWIDFSIPGAGAAHIKVGRQFLQLGNGWFFQSRKYGSDAWLVGLPGKNTIAFVDMKASENNSTKSDDTDAYVLLDNYKIDDTKTVGAYIAMVRDRKGAWTNNALLGALPAASQSKKTELDNLGLWFNGKVGPVNLQAQVDIQSGEISQVGGTTVDLEGTQWVLQASMPVDAFTFNAVLASGSGDDTATGNKVERFLNFLDKDPRMTLVYEYLMRTSAQTLGENSRIGNDKNSGFSNTQAIGIGADYKINKMFTVGANFWMLTANEKVALGGVAVNNGNTGNPVRNAGAPSDKLGNELDVKLNITLTDQLTWNTFLGYFMTGDAYKDDAGKADDVTGIQSVLSYKF